MGDDNQNQIFSAGLKNCVFYRETSLENFLASQEWGGV
jgi:hypothetical protein